MEIHYKNYLTTSRCIATATIYHSLFRLIDCFPPQKFTLSPQLIFYPSFLIEDGELGEIVLVNCMIDLKDMQVHVCLRQLSFKLDTCKVMAVVFIFWSQIVKKIITTTHVAAQVLGTRLRLSESIGQAIKSHQVMTRG